MLLLAGRHGQGLVTCCLARDAAHVRLTWRLQVKLQRQHPRCCAGLPCAALRCAALPRASRCRAPLGHGQCQSRRPHHHHHHRIQPSRHAVEAAPPGAQVPNMRPVCLPCRARRRARRRRVPCTVPRLLAVPPPPRQHPADGARRPAPVCPLPPCPSRHRRRPLQHRCAAPAQAASACLPRQRRRRRPCRRRHPCPQPAPRCAPCVPLPRQAAAIQCCRPIRVHTTSRLCSRCRRRLVHRRCHCCRNHAAHHIPLAAAGAGRCAA